MEVKRFKENSIEFIEVNNSLGLKVTLTNLGASIYSIYFNDEIMTLTAKNSFDFLKENIYYGKTIGPICGRIKNGVLNIDNKEYRYTPNEGKNALHGGKDNLSTKIFDVEIKNNEIIYVVSFKEVLYKVIYQISEIDNSLIVKYEVKAKEDTPIALTNHSYFCLGDKSIDNLYLKIDSSKYIEVNKNDLIPIQELDVINSLDFRKGKRISLDINDPYLINSRTKGYDHSLIFDKEKKISLFNDRYLLDILTDYSAAQIYSDNYIDNIPVINTDDKIRRAIAIEPQDNQLKRSEYKNYKRFISYHFFKR